jgi:hypothetical protein
LVYYGLPQEEGVRHRYGDSEKGSRRMARDDLTQQLRRALTQHFTSAGSAS